MSRCALVELADEIKDCATTLTRNLHRLGLAQPSISQGCLEAYPEDAGTQEARMKLIDALDSLKALALGCSGYFQWHVLNLQHDLSTLNMLYRFCVLTKIPLGGSKTTKELAAGCNLALPAMRRILRHADLIRFLREMEPGSGRYEHTSISAHIINTPGGMDWFGHNVDQGALASLRQAEAVEKFETHGRQSGNRNESGLGLNLFPDKGPDYSVFDFFIDDGEGAGKGWRMRRLEGAMVYLAHQNPDGQGNSVLSGFDWDEYMGMTVLNIGGSKGSLSLKIAEKHPQINFVVNDLPFAEDGFNATKAAAGPAGDQLSFFAHDFFKPWPPMDFDIALMRFILHDWSDALASKLLRNLVPALRPGARILLVEHMMPEADDKSVSRFMKYNSSAYDFQMWTETTGKERTLTDWKELFAAVDSRFYFEDCRTSAGNSLMFLTIAFCR